MTAPARTQPTAAPAATAPSPDRAQHDAGIADGTTDDPRAAAPGSGARPRRLAARLAGLGLVAALLAAWEVVVRVADVPPWLVPAPSDIGAAIAAGAADLAGAGAITLGEAVAGLVLGSLVGLAAAVAITFAPNLEQAVLSLALLVKSTPVIAVAPILTIWLGFGHAPKVVVTALLTFFPMLVNALEGFRSVDPAIVDWMRSLDASRTALFRHARWPSARPYLFAALKVSAPLALVGAVVAEWMGASSGLGRSMWLAYTNLRMPDLFAAVVVLTLLSASLYVAVVAWERRVQRWRAPDVEHR